MQLSQRDKAIIWHPLTQEKTADLPIAIKKAKGSYVYDEKDKAYLDLISSWWVNIHGHAHPEIAKAIYEQAMNLEHVIFAGFTHEPAVQICELLKTLLPESLTRFFFSDNGSTSVEIALKMAYQYWFNQGNEERKLFLSFEGDYHGDTLGAMSVGAESGFHDPFRNLFFEVLNIPFPATWDNDEWVEKKEESALAVLDEYLEKHGSRIAALITEPLVQGAKGMRMCRPEFLRKVVERVRHYHILVIYDEVMTGFGRTGTTFAMDQIGVYPDFICLSKGITGGFLPLALTVTTQKVYEAFLSDHWHQAFAHSHSYTANPIACAAAIASFKLLSKPETQSAMAAIQQTHIENLSCLKNTCKNIQCSRVQGTIAAFEVEGQYDFNLNQALKSRFLSEGLLLRPLSNTIYLIPPYSTTSLELDAAYAKIASVLETLTRQKQVSSIMLDMV